MGFKCRVVSALMSLVLITSSFVGINVVAEDSTESSADYNVTKSVNLLKAFGIIRSYNAADSEKKVTRAEAADMFVKASGIKMDSAVAGEEEFSDVTSSHEYFKSIGLALTLGIAVMSDDRLFHPDENITLKDAVSMAVRSMGYTTIAEAAGGYPSGYMSVANAQNLFKNISGTDITKSYMAVLIYNMLAADSVKIIKDANGYDTYTNDSSVTIIEKKFNVTKSKVRVEDIKTSDRYITVTVLKGDDEGKTLGYKLADSVDVSTVGGDAYIYVDKDDDGLIMYIEPLKNSFIIYDFVKEVNKNENTTYITKTEFSYVYFKNNDRNYKTDKEISIYYNDSEVTYEAYNYKNCFVKAVIAEDKIIRMDCYPLTEGGLIYRADEDELRFSKGQVYENHWTGFSSAPELEIFIDGIPGKKMQDLRQNMVFDYWTDKTKFIMVASSRVAEGILSSYSADTLTIDGEEYDLNTQYGYYNFNVKDNSYEAGGNYSQINGQPVRAFIDDNMTVRYIKIDSAKSTKDTFYGVVTNAYKEDGTEDEYVKVFNVDANADWEKLYKIHDNKLKSSSLSFDYICSVSQNMNGLGFLKFTLNADSEIIKVEKPEYFGYTASDSDSFDSDTTFIAGQYAGDANIFAALDIDGKFTIKKLNYDSNLAWAKAASGVTVISDYDLRYNPTPDYMMLTTGADTISEVGEVSGVVTDVEWKDDDSYTVKLLDGRVYTLSSDMVQKYNVKKNMLIMYHGMNLGKDPIRVETVRDLSGASDSWQTDTFKLGALNGFFKADDVVFRNDYTIQFMINGQKTDVYKYYDNGSGSLMKVYELKRGDLYQAPKASGVGDLPDYIRPVYKYPAMNIQSGDNVWFHVKTDGTPIIDYMIYESKSQLF